MADHLLTLSTKAKANTGGHALRSAPAVSTIKPPPPASVANPSCVGGGGGSLDVRKDRLEAGAAVGGIGAFDGREESWEEEANLDNALYLLYK